jgi:cytoskeletal protein CcmA (bactofilin family)
MKHFKKGIIAAALVVVPMLAWVGVAQAQRFTSHVDEDQTVNSTLYSTGKEVVVQGTINGDVICGGENVTIDATVHGDVICAGMDVTIGGTVDGDVRVAGRNVVMEGKVDGSASVAALNFSLDTQASVGRDLSLMGDSLNVKGSVGRDVVANGAAITLNGAIGRHARVETSNLRLKGDAAITGDLTYTSARDAKIAEGAAVTGKTVHSEPEAQQDAGWNFNARFFMIVLISMLLVGCTLAYLFPQLFRRTTAQTTERFGRTVFAGLIAGLVGPMLVALLLFTLVGIPLAVLLALGLLMGLILSVPVAAHFVGQLAWRKQRNPLLVMLAGTAIVVVVTFLPWIGFIGLFLTYWVGMGALVLALGQRIRGGGTRKSGKASAKTKTEE